MRCTTSSELCIQTVDCHGCIRPWSRVMALPTYEMCMLPFLRILQDGDEHRFRDVIEAAADHFGLTTEEREQLLPSGNQRVFDNRMGWARSISIISQKIRNEGYSGSGHVLTRRLSLSRSDSGSGGNLSGRLKNHLTKTAVFSSTGLCALSDIENVVEII
jgi:Mrr N-terminal domain